jgi:phage tail-like protein
VIHPNDKVYSFTAAAHWRSGAMDNLELVDGVLRVPDRLCVEPLDGSGPEDGGGLPGLDPCGRLNWLRPGTGEMMRRYPFGIEQVGVLTGSRGARAMATGRSVVWILVGSVIRRYGYADLYLLGEIVPVPGHDVVAIASDGDDGLWLLELATDAPARIRHLDCWGLSCCAPILLPDRLTASARIAATTDGRHVVVLDRDGPDTRQPGAPDARWRLIVVDACEEGAPRILNFAAGDSQSPTGLITVDRDDRIHLITRGPTLLLETIALTGERLARRPLMLPRGWGEVTALAAADTLVLSAEGRLALIVACNDLQGVEDRVSTFITPILISPAGVRSGWNRADVDVRLPEGTTLEIAVAATSDAVRIAQIQAIYDDEALSPVDRFATLSALLDWREDEAVTYAAGGASAKEPPLERLRALLDRVSDTHLWIRLTFFTPAGREPPTLEALRVLYPNRSYIEDLPAIYREESHTAAQLRRMLAPFEAIFGDLDDAISALPERIDPATAPDDWTGILLTWLGFPVLDDLGAAERRLLLEKAPDLLVNRGTREALERVLDIVTGGRASVEDLSDGPAGWFLPGAAGITGARLGRDTLVTAQQPPPFRPGQGVVLGTTPLGHGCADPAMILARRASVIVIRIGVDPHERIHLAPIIARLLSIFVPAHCRVRLIYSAGDERWRTRTLDMDLRLANPDGSGDDARLYSDAHWRVGSTTVAGRWRLPAPPFPPTVLDKSSHLNSFPRLT